jgi:HEAT repeat protein
MPTLRRHATVPLRSACAGLALFAAAGCATGSQKKEPNQPLKIAVPEPQKEEKIRAGDAASNQAVAADIAKFEDEKAMERLAAARRIAARGEVALPPLLDTLAAHPSARTRGMAAYTLGYMNDRRVVEALVRALGDPSQDVRFEAAAALLRLGDVRGYTPLIDGLESDDARVRLHCIGILADAAGSRFGFEPDGDPIERRAAVARWRGWLEHRRETGR